MFMIPMGTSKPVCPISKAEAIIKSRSVKHHYWTKHKPLKSKLRAQKFYQGLLKINWSPICEGLY